MLLDSTLPTSLAPEDDLDDSYGVNFVESTKIIMPMVGMDGSAFSVSFCANRHTIKRFMDYNW